MGSTNNYFWRSAWAMQMGMQALVAAGLVSSFFPIPLGSFLKNILPFFADMVRPEREITLYGFYAVATVFFFSMALWLEGRHVVFKSRVLWGFLCLTLQLTGVFHILLHNDPPWARVLLYGGMGLFVVTQFFAGHAAVIATTYVQNSFFRHVLEAGCLFLTVLMLYVPDQEACTARIYMGDQFHHFDQCVVGPAWAALAGDHLNVDVISQYGLGMPIILGRVAALLGGGYTAFFTVFMGAAIIYFLLFYFFLRIWLQSLLLALAGTWIAINIQMFHPGSFPFALTYPSATVIRFFWDIVFFLCLLFYSRNNQRLWIIMAGCVAGVAVFYMSSTGLCLVLSFYAFLAAQVILPQQRRIFGTSAAIWMRLAAYAVIVPLTAFVLLAIAQGAQVLMPQLWQNIAEFNNYFLSGFGTIPIYENLVNKNFWAFWMGLIIPLTYLWTVIFLGNALLAGQAGGMQLLAVVLSIYGFGLYHYYIARSAPTSFYTVAVPFVAILCFWMHVLSTRCSPKAHARGLRVVAAGAFCALWINPQFAGYPNVFNSFRHYASQGLNVLSLPDGKAYFNHGVISTARIPAANSLGEMDERLPTETDFKNTEDLKNFFRQEFDFTADAKLIDSLTAPNDKVALISSFDVRILMQARRRPFFYHYPVFLSRPMRMHAFAVPAIYTVDQIKRTIAQMESERPEYIFIERIYSKENTVFADSTNALQWLLLYVHTHYDPVAQGRFLVALQRRKT